MLHDHLILFTVALFFTLVAFSSALQAKNEHLKLGMYIIMAANIYGILENTYLQAWDHWTWQSRGDWIGDTIGFIILAIGMYFIWKGRTSRDS